jgi:hypothetical protein
LLKSSRRTLAKTIAKMNAVFKRMSAQTIALLALLAAVAAVPLGAPLVFEMMPETSSDNPIKSYAANAVISSSPSGTSWWALVRVLNASGCVEDRRAGPQWFHDPTFWFVSADTYGESSATVGPYYYCVQAWSDLPDQGGALLATSNSVTVHFDFTRQSLTASLSAVSPSAGVLRLTADYAVAPDWKGNPVPVHTLQSWWNETKLFSWVKCYAKVNSSGDYVLDSKGYQAFDFDSSGYTHTPVPFLAASFSRPGIKYFAIQNMWNGEYGWSWPRQGLGLPSLSAQPMTAPWPHGAFQPLAVVFPYENGTVDGLPPAFAGPVFKAAAIPGDLRLPLLRDALFAFNGSTSHFPLMEEYVAARDCNNPQSLCPAVMELNLPAGVTPTCSSKAAASCRFDVASVPCQHIPPPAPRGDRACFRLSRRPGAQWSYENSAIDVSWKLLGGVALLYGEPLDAAARVLANAAAAARSDNWQTFTLTVVKLNQLPTPRLMTNSYGWTNLEEFGCPPPALICPGRFAPHSTTGAFDPVLAVANLRNLGFNYVPASG